MNSFLKKASGLRMAHEAVMLDDAKKMLDESRRVISKHNRTIVGDDSPESEAMGDINIGDHYTTELKSEPKGSTVGKVAMVIGSMLLSGGVGAGAVLPVVMTLLNKNQPPPQVAPEVVDDDFELQLLDQPPPLQKSLRR